MFPEDIARRHEEMHGYDLVDYAEIALPLWQLSVEAVSIAHRKFPPIQEYVLRSVASGLSVEEISGFLGLEAEIVETAILGLVADRLIRFGENRVSEEGVDVVLTEAGIRALAEEGIATPIEDQLQVFFDGIQRIPTFVPADQLAHPRETESGALVEIPPLPAAKPQVSELDLADMQKYVSRQVGPRSELGKDVVSLKRIARHKRMFRRAVGLVFKGQKHRDDLRLRIIVGGVLAEETERQFADRGGLARPGFVRAFSDSFLNANLRKHLGSELAGAILDDDEAYLRSRTFSIAKLKMGSFERRMGLVSAGEISSDEGPTEEEYRRGEEELRQAAAALAQPRARVAIAYEHTEFLRNCLRQAKKSISISSRGLAAAYVTPQFVAAVEAALKKGVQISITVNRSTFERDRVREPFNQPYLHFQKLAKTHGNLELRTNGENRYFHLALDASAALVSNRPFLSNAGRIRTFEQYSGYFIQDADLVQRYLGRFG
jgi:hypothetical protein